MIVPTYRKAYTPTEKLGRNLPGKAPADIAFFEDTQGKTWLSVANANHYYNFDSGSVLLIDWESVDKTKGATNLMHTLSAVANDTSNYIGAVARFRQGTCYSQRSGIPKTLLPQHTTTTYWSTISRTHSP